MTWRMLTPLSSRSLGRYEDPLSGMRRELDRMFDDMWRGLPSTAGVATASSMALRLDVKEDDKSFHVTADLPGLSEKEVEITFDDGMLTIRGEKKVERDEQQGTWHLVERSYGSFARQLSLSANIDANRIEASFNKGVLSINLPKLPSEQAKAKKIEIKAR